MPKLIKFNFSTPINELKRDGASFVQVHKGDLNVDAILNVHGRIEINSVSWNGSDITAIFKMVPQTNELYQYVLNAATCYIESLEPEERFQLEEYGNILQSHQLAFASRHRRFLLNNSPAKIYNL